MGSIVGLLSVRWLIIAALTCMICANEEGDAVLHRFLNDMCVVGQDQPGTFRVTCSCKVNQDLIISGSDTANLPSTLTAFHIHGCNNSRVVLKTGALGHFHHLRNITFTSISNLVLESNSTDLHLFDQEDFLLTFDNILGLGLYLEVDAIKIKSEGGTGKQEKLTIQNTIIRGLQRFAVSGSFSELLMDTVILSDLAGTKAINTGEVETEVIISVLNASNQGALGSEWLSGSVRSLTVTDSNLVLKPRAFAGIELRGSPSPVVVIRNNQFGSPKWIPGNNETYSEPSLPSGVFDFDIPAASKVSITAENNRITCECKDLSWLLETSENGLQNSLDFTCIEGNLASALEACQLPLDNSSASQNKMLSGILIALMLIVISIGL